MAVEYTKELCIEKYAELKLRDNGRVPQHREYLRFASLTGRQLSRLFGKDAYSKLQAAAGDTPNKLDFSRTPTEQIMRQYGSLVSELEAVPTYSEWDHRGLRPTDAGLAKPPHNIKWSEFPQRFLE